jgi:hypothetical protein
VKTPIVFLIFSRPDTTARVFEAIREAKPPRLLVVADGPRADRPGEAERCAATRAIIEGVDWECEVSTNYSDVNLGLKERVSSGLTWAFQAVDEAIILEDDCVPHPTFFRYCEEMLERYRDDQRVMTISGDNFQFGRRRTDESYYFSRYPHCWGWATWRRAWQQYDGAMSIWPRLRDGGWLKDLLGTRQAVSYWRGIFDAVYEKRINSWAYRWTLTCWAQSGLTVLPNVNLVSNVGFMEAATNTTDESYLANIPAEALSFPLRHPSFMIRDAEADAFTQRTLFAGPSLPTRVRGKTKQILRMVRVGGQ